VVSEPRYPISPSNFDQECASGSRHTAGPAVLSEAGDACPGASSAGGSSSAAGGNAGRRLREKAATAGSRRQHGPGLPHSRHRLVALEVTCASRTARACRRSRSPETTSAVPVRHVRHGLPGLPSPPQAPAAAWNSAAGIPVIIGNLRYGASLDPVVGHVAPAVAGVVQLVRPTDGTVRMVRMTQAPCPNR
jgi:hypothetical protein